MTDETNDVEQEETEEEFKFDAKHLEQQMVESAQARAEDPTETALSMYHMFVPSYQSVVPKLSTRALRRILNYVVLYPLVKADVNPANDSEREVMQLVSALVEAKFIVIMDQYRLNAEQVYAAATAELTEEQENEVKAALGE